MATRKRTTKKTARKSTKRRSSKKGTLLAKLPKKVPDGYLAFVSGSEVRITKRKGARKTKRTAKKRARR